jgi:hypothetical protein
LIALASPIALFSFLILLYTDSGGVTLLSASPSILCILYCLFKTFFVIIDFFPFKVFVKVRSNFYNLALYTKVGILLHPGKLVRAMIDTLPDNVELLENTQLNDTEYKSIGEPREWGVLPVRPMGATIRMTKDKRILIRNTAEVHSPFKMSKTELDERSLTQKLGIKKRFPSLADDIVESSWSGVVSRTRNSSQIFDKIDNNVFAAGCYNGSGIGVGTLFGEQIAIKASNENSDEINIIESRTKPTWLPPQPFLNIGVKTRLMFERFRSRSDV